MDWREIDEIKDGLFTAINGLEKLKTQLGSLDARLDYLMHETEKNDRFFNDLEKILRDRRI